MKRARVNAIVDMVAFGAVLVSLFTGILLWKVLPSGGGGPRAGQAAGHALFLGIERGVWKDVHTVTTLVFVGLVVVHILLHWKWIRCIPRFFSRQQLKTCAPVLGDTSDERRLEEEE